ncbi:lipopolysaccharide biosynthesis protein [Mesorhizobium sp. CAU 1741]|uniref:lipopolysaccharide biosynthesis protein n=1 Tax=Mesorhizobium sp. CAU 1741 TaxID=3140366 RepID=UPI00325BDADD
MAASQAPMGRVMRGVGANAYDKAAILVVQLLSIPLLSREWGAEGYGIWLMLMTVPVYLQLTDFGLGAAATVEMTRGMARGDRATVRQIFQCIWLMVTGVSLATAAIVIGIAAAVESSGAPFGAIVLVTLYGLLVMQINMQMTVYRAIGKFATSVVFTGTVLLVEGIAVVVIAAGGGGIVVAMAALLVLRAAALTGFAIHLHRVEPWARPGLRAVSAATMRSLTRPSLAALSLTLAGAVVLQGALLTLGWAAGPATVAIFGGARTVSRAPLQFAGLFTRASLPELTLSQARGDVATISRLNRLNMLIALAATIPFALLLAGFGPQILAALSGGALKASTSLFALLGAAVIANAVWMAEAAPLIAQNRQGGFGSVYLCTCLCVVTMPLITPGDPMGVLAGAILVSEIFCCLSVAASRSRVRRDRCRFPGGVR